MGLKTGQTALTEKYKRPVLTGARSHYSQVSRRDVSVTRAKVTVASGRPKIIVDKKGDHDLLAGSQRS